MELKFLFELEFNLSVNPEEYARVVQDLRNMAPRARTFTPPWLHVLLASKHCGAVTAGLFV